MTLLSVYIDHFAITRLFVNSCAYNQVYSVYFVARVANIWYDILLFASFCIAILSLRYILLTRYCFDVTALYSLMRLFSGEILNSPDTRKPKTHFCQYYRAIKLIHTYQVFSWCLKMLYKVSKGCGYRILQNYSCCSRHSKRQLVISFLRVF